ncbi:hypothetical protein BAJUN_00900 [Bajunvirus bajun]|uniref:Uncharacterized protein n=1 Tax=Brevundimonas phage vB_BgoS-Bajun TaxID=2948594 RepID=A0A9E7SU28_9CAUD|nr:hypothetical protein BAJUN_00900 [Brevundimonas phage vB_BgoS-Bajun]
MPELKHKKPCKVCPWRRESAPGWLGSSTPEEFLAQAKMELHMPCHAAIDYEREDWRAQAEAGPHCAGSLIFLANHCILPRDPVLAAKRAQVETDRETVFAHSAQFLAHHQQFQETP